ncbi:class I SAM-dependent rRNA methyltransferase [Deferribacter abyssi]|uniref:class I SAM-dependent rRNA methyltransferase n=1 Tax=Deferribacter abyssi TaxID=213806 RepID=UPI003C26912F
MKTLFLKKGFDRRVQAGYLWIFSNEVENIRDFVPGEVAKIYTHNKEFLGIGYVNPHSLICARILSKKDINIDINFVKNRISTALSLRKILYDKPYYRLLFSEGDFLPGVIIDRYDNLFSIQLNTFWADKNKDLIITALKELFSDNIKIVLKNDNTARLLETLPLTVESLNNKFNGDIFFEENNIKMYVNIFKAQKTGYYFDQRENKKLMQLIANNMYVVDVFSYIGGWGLNALKNHAKKVTFVDISAFALECAEENVKMNKFKAETEFLKIDAIDFLKNLAQNKEKPDILVIDPPAFVKSKKKLSEALKGYINLNKWALKSVKKNGFIFTCSCSQHVDEEKFHWILNNAAKTAGKKFKILSKLTQGFDHPVNPKMKETFYLKGFFIQVL